MAAAAAAAEAAAADASTGRTRRWRPTGDWQQATGSRVRRRAAVGPCKSTSSAVALSSRQSPRRRRCMLFPGPRKARPGRAVSALSTRTRMTRAAIPAPMRTLVGPPFGVTPAIGAGQARRTRLGLLDQERVVAGGAQDGPSSRGIQAWEPLPSRAHQKLADLTLGQVARRDVMTDGKEHVWGDIGLAGVVLPDDVGDDRGKVSKSYARTKCDHARL